MENEFIPYEEALALKELGFDEACLKEFHKCILLTNSSGEEATNSELIYLYGKKGTVIAAPLYQQAFNWLQNKLEVDVSITMWQDGSGHLNELHHDKDIFTFENELECLKQLLILIKNK